MLKKLTAAGLKKVHIMLTCDISTYSSSYIVNCADKYKLQITNYKFVDMGLV